MKRKNVFFKRRDAYIGKWSSTLGNPVKIAENAYAAGWKARGREERKKHVAR